MNAWQLAQLFAGTRSKGEFCLEYLTIAWNVFEGIVAVASGVAAGSIALVGFGIDSFIETSSGGVLLWRLKAERSGQDAQQVERRALRVVGIGFILRNVGIWGGAPLSQYHQIPPAPVAPCRGHLCM
jgi:hypothetical protein